MIHLTPPGFQPSRLEQETAKMFSFHRFFFFVCFCRDEHTQASFSSWCTTMSTSIFIHLRSGFDGFQDRFLLDQERDQHSRDNFSAYHYVLLNRAWNGFGWQKTKKEKRSIIEHDGHVYSMCPTRSSTTVADTKIKIKNKNRWARVNDFISCPPHILKQIWILVKKISSIIRSVCGM